MTINLQQFIVFLPFLILILTAAISMLSISYNRNHLFVFRFSILGLMVSFFLLFFLIKMLPIDITVLFHITRSSILYIGMVIISSITTCIFAYSWLENYLFNKEEFYLLIIFSTLGSTILIISNHMSSLLIGIELMSLPIFGLIAYSHSQQYSLEASFKYIILSGVSLSFLLLGIAWVYSISGDLGFTLINKALNTASLNHQLVILSGIMMILLSLFFKLSVVPFHLWTPDIYQGSPSLVLSFFSTAGKISLFSILIHFFSCISILHNEIIYFMLSLITSASILFGNTMALFQDNIKRFFGYSSISQIGCLFVVFLSSNRNNLFYSEAIGVYLFSYLLSNIAYFGIINLISYSHQRKEVDLLSQYKGLFWSKPILSSVLTVVLLSLAGIPMTLGFIGKFYILSIIIQERLWVVGCAFLIGSLLGVYCYLRIIINLYSIPLEASMNNLNISNYWFVATSGAIILISGIILLILGIYPSPLISLVRLF